MKKTLIAFICVLITAGCSNLSQEVLKSGSLNTTPDNQKLQVEEVEIKNAQTGTMSFSVDWPIKPQLTTQAVPTRTNPYL